MIAIEYFLFFPIAVLAGITTATIRLGSAVLIVPAIILLLDVDPLIAIGAGLITDVFYLVIRLYRYMSQKVIDYKLGLKMILVVIPSTLLGAWVASELSSKLLYILLGIGLFGVAFSCIQTLSQKRIDRLDQLIVNQYGAGLSETQITTADKYFSYTPHHLNKGRLMFSLGGFLVGLITTNLGKYNNYLLLQICHVPSRVSAATAVLLHAVAALTGSIAHLLLFYRSSVLVMPTIIDIVLFTIPGILIGSYLGPNLSSIISGKHLDRSLAIVFIGLAIFLLGKTMT